MRVFEELADDKRIHKYGVKASKLGVSTVLLQGRAMNYGIPVHKMVGNAVSKEKFNRKVRSKLYGATQADFYDFSLMMGLYFGFYNAYGYLFIANDIKTALVETDPNFVATKKILDQYQLAIKQYFYHSYGFDGAKTEQLITNMMSVSTDYELYNKIYVQDMGKIVMGVTLLYDKEEIVEEQLQIESMISSGIIIHKFNSRNDVKSVYTKKLKK